MLLNRLGGNDSDDSDKSPIENKPTLPGPPPKSEIKPPLNPPILHSTNTATAPKAPEKKRESKWGKNSSSNDTLITVRH